MHNKVWFTIWKTRKMIHDMIYENNYAGNIATLTYHMKYKFSNDN